MKLSSLSRIILIISGIFSSIAVFVPLWRIELSAPQYPEGLVLQMYTYKLAGQVDIINGLNHYIGMGTLHAENFIEFTILPYIIGVFACLFWLTAWKNNRTWLLSVTISFALFGILSMADFWRWEYNYGHNLDPHAAIVVPGMSYQPPLIGFKQLLNMGAFSIPDIGGWLITLTGLLLVWATLKEYKKPKFLFKNLTVILFFLIVSCTQNEPVPIQIHHDACHFCKMKISDPHFGAELITEKGRIYTFDDITCLLGYQKQNPSNKNQVFIHDFLNPGVLINAKKAVYLHDESFKSPMGGNYAAFDSEEKAKKFNVKNLQFLKWEEVR